MDFVVTILIGVGVGIMVELLLPGHTMSELLLAMSLGVAGALVSQFIGHLAEWFAPGEPAAFLVSGAGAILTLVMYGVFFRRRHT